MDKTLRSRAFDSYKNHKLASWMLAVFCGLILAGLIILCSAETILLFFVVPIILLPFLFSCYMMHLGFSYNKELSLSGFTRFFTLFFRKPFNSSFNFWFSFFKFLICSIVLEALFGLISYIVCSSINPTSFNEMLNTFFNIMTSVEAVTDLKTAFGDNYSMYLIFINVSSIPTSIISFIYFVYNIVFYSGSIYFRAAYKNVGGKFLNYVYRYTTKTIAKDYKKDFLMLEWPLFVLICVGSIIGATVPLLFTANTAFITLCGTAGGILLATFYLPFHFPNMESLYKKYEDSFKYGISSVTQNMINNFQMKMRETGMDVENPSEVKEEDEDKKT